MWVITVDGLSASGKTSLSRALAKKLSADFLPSGVLYRICAWLDLNGIDIDFDNFTQHVSVVNEEELKIFWQDQDVTLLLNDPKVSEKSSILAVCSDIRRELLKVQRLWSNTSGLVAEGRDMGSVVFPDACLKWFIESSVDLRAKRRHKQLLDLGICAKFEDIWQDISSRDFRDKERKLSPLVIPDGAICIDNSENDLLKAVDYMVEISLLYIGVAL